ncbi:MAG TPA: DUF2255 family protein [Myxococcota bacterium]|nr:DUF2255 family protein [Myxococcota bacterium]
MHWVRALLALASLSLASHALAQANFDWTPAREESVIEVLTADADGDLRETPVWIVVLDGAGFVRTNDSKWLANIRRGSPVRLRVRNVESAMVANEVSDAALRERVEAAFKEKYGTLQRMMSLFRMREPVVLRLDPRASE